MEQWKQDQLDIKKYTTRQHSAYPQQRRFVLRCRQWTLPDKGVNAYDLPN